MSSSFRFLTMMVLMEVKNQIGNVSIPTKTATEIEEELLSEQKNTINNLEKNISENQNQQKEFEKIQQEIQRKKKGSWSDQKKYNLL